MTVTRVPTLLLSSTMMCRDGSRREYTFSQPLFGAELGRVGQKLLATIREYSNGNLSFIVQDSRSFIAEQFDIALPWSSIEATVLPLIKAIIKEELGVELSY